MGKINKICIILVAIIVVFYIGVIVGRHMTQNHVNNQEVLIDTTYNKIILDSIEYNIIKKDSVIYNIKQEMKDEVTKSFELNDSVAVKLFKELCTAP